MERIVRLPYQTTLGLYDTKWMTDDDRGKNGRVIIT